MVAGNSASKGRIKSAIAAKTIVAASETANAMPGPVAVFLLNCLAQLDEHPLRGRCPSRTRRYSTTILESKDYLVSPVLRCDVREPRLMVAPHDGRRRSDDASTSRRSKCRLQASSRFQPFPR